MNIFWFVIIYSLNVCREEENDDWAYDESLDELDEFEDWLF